jgi:hypothetical protein
MTEPDPTRYFKPATRRFVQRRLRDVKEQLGILVSRWNSYGTVDLEHDYHGDDPDDLCADNPCGQKHTRTRPRQPHEYPENDTDYWLDLARRTRAAARQLNELSEWARSNAAYVIEARKRKAES